jgi:hypothetical protein
MPPPSTRRFLAAAGCADHGRLGLGDAVRGALHFTLLSDAALASDDVAAAAAGAAHSVAVTADGSVLSWGLNDRGQLGHSPAATFVALPREVLLPEPAVAVAAGAAHTLAVGASGGVWAWGAGEGGRLGLGADAAAGPPLCEPRRVPGLANVTAVAAGRAHSLASTSDGAVFSWGCASAGALGHAEPRGRPVEPSPRRLRSLDGARIVAVSAAGDRSAALDGDGAPWEWGAAVDGRPRRAAPPALTPGLPPLVRLALAPHRTLAVRVGGRGVAWGDGGDHAANGTPPDRATSRAPAPLATPATLADIAAGWQHGAAVGDDGRLLTWGWGGSAGSEGAFDSQETAGGGQLGHGDDLDRQVPTRVVGLRWGGGAWVECGKWRAVGVAAGFNHTLAVVEVDDG